MRDPKHPRRFTEEFKRQIVDLHLEPPVFLLQIEQPLLLRCAVVGCAGGAGGIHKLYPPTHCGMPEVVLNLDILKRLARVIEIDYLTLELLGEPSRMLRIPLSFLLSGKVPYQIVQFIIATPLRSSPLRGSAARRSPSSWTTIWTTPPWAHLSERASRTRSAASSRLQSES